ncbi:MAG TPA: FAD-dependent oxidoreductase [Casimicrobiaceae bacterium]|nr:FAD-dependent oxidoreductase [Casimicrobiaceae bacterium]
MMTDECDLVVIGGGIAGMTAALRAAELGLRARVLEQGSDERYPCNTRYSGGVLHAAQHDVKRPPAELVDIICSATRGHVDRAMAQTVATDGRRLLEWLQQQGVRFMRFSAQEAHRWCMAPPRPIAPGLDWKGRGPDVMLRTLGDRLRALGGALELGAHAEALLMDGTRCVGVRGTRQGTPCEWQAHAVVIADGGFQARLELLRHYVSPHPERLLQRGAATGRGDGIAMALGVGAAVDGMDKFYGHLQSRDALTDARVWPYPELDGVAASAIVVGPGGERLVDEGLGGIAIANALARLEDPNCATLICDSAIWDGPGKSARLPANPYLEKFGGTLHRAGMLRELALRSGIAPDALIATVEAYNEAVKSGACAKLSPPRSTDRIKAWPIIAPPFIAIPMCVGITYTMGGIVVDGDGRVQRPDGTSIAGLYAAGATTTGLEGGGEQGHVGYVGGLIKAVFGLRAAEHVAHTLRRTQATHATAT